jgi:HK97 family phage portal protein
LNAALNSLSPEARSIVISHDGVMGNWVDGTPLEELGLSVQPFKVSASSAFTGTVGVYACVALIAESIASLPLLTYRRLSDDRRERIGEQNDTRGPMAWASRLARMLHNSPNPEMTAQELWETVLGHVCLWGNAYCNVVRDNGRPTQLWPLRPDQMEIERDDKRVRRYIYTTDNGQRHVFGPGEILHVRGMSLDGVVGVSPIKVARKAVSISKAAEAYAERFWTQGGAPAGFLFADPPLTNNPERKREELKHIAEGVNSMYQGMDNAHRIGVLSGVKWEQVGLDHQDAQFIESREFQLEEIARLYRIPPHKIGILEPGSVSYASVEQQAIGFVTDTLRPWMSRIEQAINRDLGFPGDEATTLLDESIYTEFKPDALLRGTTKDRFEAYKLALDSQWMTVNDVRPLENMDPVAWGDEPNELPGAKPADAPSDGSSTGLSLVASAIRDMQPQQLTLPDINITSPPAPDVRVYNRDIGGDIREVMEQVPEPQVHIDMTPVAEAMQRGLADLAEELRQERAAFAERLKPHETRRQVIRGEDNKIVEIRDVPVEEAS